MRRTELTIHPHLAQIIVEASTRLLATFGIVAGLNIILGGRPRWTGGSYNTALMLWGAPVSWGVALSVFGAIALTGSLLGRRMPVIIGMYLIAAWNTFFALSIFDAARRIPTAGTTGIFVYGAVAVLCCCMAVAYHESRKGYNP